MELHTGHHLIYQLFGMNVNMDTLYMTWLTAAIVIIITLAATRGRSLVPSGIQNAVEIVVEALLAQFKETLGPKWGQVVSVLLTMFLFILVGNELGLLPSPHILTSRRMISIRRWAWPGIIFYGTFCCSAQPRSEKTHQTLFSTVRCIFCHQPAGRIYKAYYAGLPSVRQYPCPVKS